jgi:hypothetical protein
VAVRRPRLALSGAVIALGLAPAAQAACPPPRATAAYTSRVEQALRSRTDLWGSELLRAPGGPTYAGAARYLAPLLYARTSKDRPLTASGVYYLPFAQPEGPQGAGSVSLHVADGSQILSNDVGGASLTVAVRGERYGSCLRQLTPATLADGWLPILETRYHGFAQESFAAHVPETDALVSFVRVDGPGPIHFTLSQRGLRRDGDRLLHGGDTVAVLSRGARWDGRSITYPRGTAYVAWLGRPAPTQAFALDAERYDTTRAAIADYWRKRLTEGSSFDVPEPRVMNAERALLVQELTLTWRYSIGNPYEEFSFPEGVDVAQVMAELGYDAVARSIIRTSLTRSLARYPNWKMGEKLVAVALHYRLFADKSFVDEVTPTLRRYVSTLTRKLDSHGLLGRERYSSDIPDLVYGFHSQSVVLQGVTQMAAVWAQIGHAADAARARSLAARLGPGLRRAVRASERRLPDSSLFVPARLLDDELPYDTVTQSRSGSYWNLVAPYGLASGILAPGGSEATGALRYLLLHGSRLLGLVRAGAYALYGRTPTPPESGTDEVYGINVARFLAQQDEPDQLVLSLYGQLAAAMTPNTFVSGEGATVMPLHGQLYRAMYLPPNGASNAAFLETLHQLLVQETATGLRLAFATPRGWLRPGRRIAVSNAATRFGPLSYSLEAADRTVRVHLDVPSRRPPATLALRLRLPAGRRIVSVSPARRFDARTGTVDLSGERGSLDLVVRTS